MVQRLGSRPNADKLAANPPDGPERRSHGFWSRKLAVRGRQGVHIFSRSLRYRNQGIKLPGGTMLPPWPLASTKSWAARCA
jgi:hypothetical protein